MKNGFFMALGVAIWAILKQIFKFFGKVIQLLTSLFLFLGLYIPLFYIVFGLILLAATPFTFGGTGTDQVLYYIGLGLSFLAAGIITWRNLLVQPISSVFSAFRRRSKDRYDDEPDDERDPRYDDRRGYGYDPYRARGGYDGRPPYGDPGYPPNGYAYPREYGYPPRDGYGYSPREDRYAPSHSEDGYGRPPMREEGERPLVYYSKRRPGVLVEEYSDRFELYREDASGKTHIGTEYKDD